MLGQLFNFIKSHMVSPETYARKKGVKIGVNCVISGRNHWSSEPYLIEIGNNVRIASGTKFFTHGGITMIRRYYNNPQLDRFGKIKVGDFTSFGENCIINPGVTIGRCCVIGAGSVVTKSIPDGCMVGGNPAKFICYTEDFYNRIKEKSTGTYGMNPKQKKKYLLSLPTEALDQKPFIQLPEKQ